MRGKKLYLNKRILLSVLLLVSIIYLTPIFVYGQDHPNNMEDRNVIINPGEKRSISFSDYFEYCNIEIKIILDTSYSHGTLSYNISGKNGLVKTGEIHNELDFIFTYTNKCAWCYLNIKNIGNVTVKYDLTMLRRVSNEEILNYYVIPCLIIVAVVGLSIYIIVQLKKRKKN